MTAAMSDPMKIKVMPSLIHSIVRTRWLSTVMSPKPTTTVRVGNRWATPHTAGIAAPR